MLACVVAVDAVCPTFSTMRMETSRSLLPWIPSPVTYDPYGSTSTNVYGAACPVLVLSSHVSPLPMMTSSSSWRPNVSADDLKRRCRYDFKSPNTAAPCLDALHSRLCLAPIAKICDEEAHTAGTSHGR